jgi:hypothetical protein
MQHGGQSLHVVHLYDACEDTMLHVDCVIMALAR